MNIGFGRCGSSLLVLLSAVPPVAAQPRSDPLAVSSTAPASPGRRAFDKAEASNKRLMTTICDGCLGSGPSRAAPAGPRASGRTVEAGRDGDRAFVAQARSTAPTPPILTRATRRPPLEQTRIAVTRAAPPVSRRTPMPVTRDRTDEHVLDAWALASAPPTPGLYRLPWGIARYAEADSAEADRAGRWSFVPRALSEGERSVR